MADTKSTTSAKLDLLDAIARDRRVSASEFRVAFILRQHMGPKGIFPSLELVSLETGIKPRQLQNLVNGLITKGWLKKRRPNRQATNRYEFDASQVESVQSFFLEQRDHLAEARARRRSDQQEIADQETTETPEIADRERQRIAGPDQQEIAAYLPSRNPSVEHHEEGIDEGGSGAHWSSAEPREEADGGSEPPSERAPEAASGRHIDLPIVSDALLSSRAYRTGGRSPAETLAAQFGNDKFPTKGQAA